MLIVAVDTSGRKGGVSLCRGDRESFEVLQLISLEGGTYSARLMPRIAEALRQSEVEKTQVDGFVVVSGPGSFTGLRVGLATVKGLCEALGKPLATVSMLDAVALIPGSPNVKTSVLLDAGRGEIYVGEFHVSASGCAEVVREYIAELEAFPARGDKNCGALITPDAKVAEALQASSICARLVPAVRADQVGRIGIRKLITAHTADPVTIDVNYIRRSDAEIFAVPKR